MIYFQKALGSYQGTLESNKDDVKYLEDYKKETALLNSSVMKSKDAGKCKGKPGAKNAKKSLASRSKGKGEDKNLKGKPNKGANKKTCSCHWQEGQ